MTSSNVKKNNEFIRLLIKSTPHQARALLYTITKDQAKAIAEIFYNLLYINKLNNNNNNNRKKYNYIRRKTKFFKSIINKKNRRSLIRTQRTLVLKILKEFQDLIKNQLQ
jgi:hypothetical protein